jgi:hypothetical protein
VTPANVSEDWFFLPASLSNIGTSGVKAAPRGDLKRAWNIHAQKAPFPRQGRVRDRNGIQQGPGVWMQGIPESLRPVGEFHDLSQVHDGDTVGDMFDHRQIMSDDDICEAETFLDPLQKVYDLGADRL